VEKVILKGYNGDLIVSDAGITIRRGWKGAVTQMAMRGEKVVPWSSVGTVDFKKAGITPGFIRLSYQGGWESHGGANPSILDESAVTWLDPRKNAEAARIRDLILERSG
jgi:hypothetical protein